MAIKSSNRDFACPSAGVISAVSIRICELLGNLIALQGTINLYNLCYAAIAT
jgi:hypothetical protein